MRNGRIDYVDYLKGLAMIVVVWHHAPHFEMERFSLGFTFSLPFFFFASGMFFKTTSYKSFAISSVKRLLIPFAIYYLLYYVFMILEHRWETGSFASFRYDYIFCVFRRYADSNIYQVDPPLWFISSLLWLQLICLTLTKITKSRLAIAVLAVAGAILGTKFVQPIPTWFMLGRSFNYLIYFAFGMLFGKQLIGLMDSSNRQYSYIPLALAVLIYAGCLYYFRNVPRDVTHPSYFEGFCWIIFLMYLFKSLRHSQLLKPFRFYGVNSLPVLGLHLIILTILGDAYLYYTGGLNPYIGIVMTILTLLILRPLINWLNRKLPIVVGKGWK